MLAGSQVGLVLGEKLKRGRKREAMVFAPTSALGNVSGNGRIFSLLLLQDHLFLLGPSYYHVVPTLGSRNMDTHLCLSDLELVDTFCC